MANDDLNKKTDEELLKIINLVDAPFDGIHNRVQAKIILYNRKKASDDSVKRMTLWILILTIALVGLTAALVYFEFSPFRFISESSKTLQPQEVQPFPQKHKPAKQHNAQKTK